MTKRDAISMRRTADDDEVGPMEAAIRDRQEIAESITVPEARLHRMRTFRVADVVIIVVVVVADKYKRRISALCRNACS